MAKKLLFFDHSFHQTTHSTDFLISLLREAFDVTIVWDDSWKGTGRQAVKTYSGDWDAIVFFQLPPPDEVDSLECRNITYIPMYDSAPDPHDLSWRKVRHLKAVSFSKTLDASLKVAGIHSFYSQYFPQPLTQSSARVPDTGLFFWQRISDLGWPTVRCLIEGSDIGPIHIHDAVDPGHKFCPPTREEEKAFAIRRTSWFPDGEQFLRAISGYRFFVAPRKKEGIGMSFLQAMAMGRVVIAADGPTMNEYITNGTNGILFDPYNPRKLDLRGSGDMAARALETVTAGFARWSRTKYELLDFIAKPWARRAFLWDRAGMVDLRDRVRKRVKNVRTFLGRDQGS